MTRTEIILKLRTIITENLEHDVPEQLKETDRIYEDLNIDSIMVLQLIVYIEEQFDVTVPEDDIDPSVFETVGAFVGFVGDLLKEKTV